MYSISFPKMFKASQTKLLDEHDATFANLRLALLSYKGELYGDPEFGSNLAKFIYENNGSILKDLVIDDIYDTIKVFMPQVIVERDNIDVTSDGLNLYVSIQAINQLGYVNDLYTINLTESEN